MLGLFFISSKYYFLTNTTYLLYIPLDYFNYKEKNILKKWFKKTWKSSADKYISYDMRSSQLQKI